MARTCWHRFPFVRAGLLDRLLRAAGNLSVPRLAVLGRLRPSLHSYSLNRSERCATRHGRSERPPIYSGGSRPSPLALSPDARVPSGHKGERVVVFPTGSLEAWSLGSITQVYLDDTDVDIISAYQNAKCICSIKSKTEGLRLRQPL